MDFLQIVQDRSRLPVSGADLRNDAIARALGQLGVLRQLAVSAPRPEDQPREETLRQLPAPDLIVVEGVPLLAQAEICRRLWPRVPLVIDFHNVESRLLAETDRARLPRGLRRLAAVLFRRRWQQAVARDRRALELSDRIWTCTDGDRALAGALEVAADISVLPNIIPPWAEAMSPGPHDWSGAGPEMLFLGHLGYAPNKKAARHLARRVLPAVRRSCPGARLTIAGRNPNARLRRDLTRQAHVTLLADPPEVAPLYESADLALMPLTEGGGSRIKVLEAFAAGLPVIASAKAVEGLEVTPGVEFLQADTAAQSARAVARLQAEPDLRRALIDRARDWVLGRHGQAAMNAAVAAEVAQLTERRRSHG